MAKEPCYPRIKRILMSYQDSAELNLNGPTRLDIGPPYISMSNSLGVPARAGTVSMLVRKNTNPGLQYTQPVQLESSYNIGTKRRKMVPAKPVEHVKLETERRPVSNSSLKLEVAEVLASFATLRRPLVCAVARTELEGKPIACFEVGGEKRLCLPDVLNTVLHKFPPEDISDTCENLHINISQCDADQLAALKYSGVLPDSVARCGLITKSDAERMCSTILHDRPARNYRPVIGGDDVLVQHQCFGVCNGIFRLNLYTIPSASCVQCVECGDMLTPAQFVSHGHRDLENKTFHWGFDSANWRSYLMLQTDQGDLEKQQKMLDDLKLRFLELENSGMKEEFVDESRKRRFDEVKAASSAAWSPVDLHSPCETSLGILSLTKKKKVPTATLR